MNAPPFAPDAPVYVVVPSEFAQLEEAARQSLANMAHILHEARPALECELGAPLIIGTDAPPDAARWLIGPAACNPLLQQIHAESPQIPTLILNRAQRLLITDAPTPDGVWELFSWLRTLARLPDGAHTFGDCETKGAAIQRLMEEVGDSYPAFELRHLDWGAICKRYLPEAQAAEDVIPVMQRWLAELGDGHTWVRPVPPHGDLPYTVWLEKERAHFVHIPPESAAWQAGVRAGDVLIKPEAQNWWARTPSTPPPRALVAGRRLLQAPIGTRRELVAQTPDGRFITWEEAVTAPYPFGKLAEWRKLDTGAGYLKIYAWINRPQLDAIVQEAFEALRDAPGLIVDLRGNPGGDLSIAQAFRDRFLREAGIMGTIRYSTGYRQLTPPEPIYGEPAPEHERWKKPARFLINSLTYSASEDAILGLQGLPHIEVLGAESGGGSGRLRVLRLLPGWRLTISTALTYDRNGRCIEGAGIPVDLFIPTNYRQPDAEDFVLQYAARGW
jgi:carboxyl-terminal processing protease